MKITVSLTDTDGGVVQSTEFERRFPNEMTPEERTEFIRAQEVRRAEQAAITNVTRAGLRGVSMDSFADEPYNPRKSASHSFIGGTQRR